MAIDQKSGQSKEPSPRLTLPASGHALARPDFPTSGYNFMRFKYQSEIESIPDCPPDDYRSQRLKAYRFVFEDTNHQNNFRPVLIIKPRRRKTGMFRRNTAKCQGYGLSFFDSLENAQKKYFKLIKTRPQLAKTLGTHIAEGVIDHTDGVVSKINREGHFTLHEFEQVDLKNKFRPVLEVYDNAKNKGNQGP